MLFSIICPCPSADCRPIRALPIGPIWFRSPLPQQRAYYSFNAAERQHITEYCCIAQERVTPASLASRAPPFARFRMFLPGFFLSREKLPGDGNHSRTIDSPKTLADASPHTLDYEEVGRLLSAPNTHAHKCSLARQRCWSSCTATGLACQSRSRHQLSDKSISADVFLRSFRQGPKDIVPIATTIEWYNATAVHRGPSVPVPSCRSLGGSLPLLTAGQLSGRRRLGAHQKITRGLPSHRPNHHGPPPFATVSHPPASTMVRDLRVTRKCRSRDIFDRPRSNTHFDHRRLNNPLPLPPRSGRR